MKRKPITLLVGVAAIAGLTSFYFYLKSYNEKGEEAALEEASGEEILNVDTDAVNKISFYINEEEEVFYLEEDQWKLESDETFPVNSSAVVSTISQLSPLAAVRVLGDVEDISEYGLDAPQNVITLTDEDGRVTTVTIGDTNNATGNDYLMLGEDESVVYTIEDTLRSTFSDDLYDYAYSDEMPTLLVSDMTGLSVVTRDGGYELYLEDARWMVDDLSQGAAVGETGIGADSDAVSSAMSSLGSLAYADYVEHNYTEDIYGFEETDIVLTIYYQMEVDEETEVVSDSETGFAEAAAEGDADSTEESIDQTEAESGEVTENETETETEVQKEERSISFRIGTTDSLGNYYVQMEGSTEVHTLSSTTLDNFLGKTASDWEAEEPETETEIETAAETETETTDVESEAAD